MIEHCGVVKRINETRDGKFLLVQVDNPYNHLYTWDMRYFSHCCPEPKVGDTVSMILPDGLWWRGAVVSYCSRTLDWTKVGF